MADDIPFTPDHLAKLCGAFERRAEYLVSKHPDGMHHRFREGDKSVEFWLPEHAPEEIWIALFEGDDCLFQMYEEPCTEEGKQLVLRLFESVATRFLGASIRVARRYWLIGEKELQYLDGKVWRDIYS